MAVDRHTHVNDTSEEQTEMKAASSFFGNGAPNNSLDASGISGLVIDNLSVMWLSPAASTQPFDG